MAASAAVSGSPPLAAARAIATGTTMFALAVLLVNSLVITATSVAAVMSITFPGGSQPVRLFPRAAASPVERESSPRAMPPP